MRRSEKRILTTHVGSLVRPAAIVEAMRAKENAQPYDEKALAANVRAAVADVVRRQAEAGIDIPSDGEQGKTGFFRYLYDRMDGLKPTAAAAGRDDAGDGAEQGQARFRGLLRAVRRAGRRRCGCLRRSSACRGWRAPAARSASER